MRDALKRGFESQLAIGKYMHEQSTSRDQHTIVFLNYNEILQLTGDNESPHPVFYAAVGDDENLYINNDGICPDPEQIIGIISHENLHLVLHRMWAEDPDDVEVMAMSGFIDILNENALDSGVIDRLDHLDGEHSWMPRLENTGLPDNLETVCFYSKQSIELKSYNPIYGLVRSRGVEPLSPAWQAGVLGH